MNRLRWLALLFFFISGTISLIYEILWQRNLCLVLGDSAQATAAVLSAFMAGISLGAFFFGKIAAGKGRPLKMLALMDLGLGLYALVFPLLLWAIAWVYQFLYGVFPGTGTGISLVRFILCFFALFLPATLMGGSLPVAAGFFLSGREKIGMHTGVLYGVNTGAGALGAVLSVFILMRFFGVKETAYIAAGLNFLAGAGFFLLHKSTAQKPFPGIQGKTGEDRHPDADSVFRSVFLILQAAFTGFSAMAFQAIWVRGLLFFITGEIYSFAILVSAFLSGTALGSIVISGFLDKISRPFSVLFILQGLTALSGIITPLQFTALGELMQITSLFAQPGWSAIVFVRYILCYFILLVPTFLMGMIFPLLYRVYAEDTGAAAKKMGYLFSANSLGSVFGPLAAFFFLMPVAGLPKSIVIISMIHLMLSLGALFMEKELSNVRQPLYAGGLILIFSLFFFISPLSKPLGLSASVYKDILHTGQKVVFHKEGPLATVTVRETQRDPLTTEPLERMLDVNGVNIAGTDPHFRIFQNFPGHLPVLLFTAQNGRPPEKVFTVGLGTGDASYSICTHPIKGLYCSEIVKTEVDALPFFSRINRDILSNPRFHLVLEDARNRLFADHTLYDVIENDAVYPHININNYTRQYFAFCRDRLTENGIFSTWLTLTNLSNTHFKVIIKTVADVFPHVSLWYAPKNFNPHALLVAGKKPLQFPYKPFEHAVFQELVHESLEESRMGDPLEILGAFVADETQIIPTLKDIAVNTDNNLYLAFRIPEQKKVGTQTLPDNLDYLAALTLPGAPGFVQFPEELNAHSRFQTLNQVKIRMMEGVSRFYEGELEKEASAFSQANALDKEAWDAGYHLEQTRIRQGVVMMESGLLDEAIIHFNQALELNPDSLRALFYKGMIQYQSANIRQARATLEKALALNPHSPALYNALGNIHVSRKEIRKAEAHFQKAIHQDNTFAKAYVNLGTLYFATQQYTKAKPLLERAVSLSPHLPEPRYYLSFLYANEMRFDKARKELKAILKQYPGFAPAKETLGKLDAVEEMAGKQQGDYPVPRPGQEMP